VACPRAPHSHHAACRIPQEWFQSFIIPFTTGKVKTLQFKGARLASSAMQGRMRCLIRPRAVWHNDRVGTKFLGVASVAIPAANLPEPVETTLVLEKREKHENTTLKLASAAGVQSHELGTLIVKVHRLPYNPENDMPRQGLLSSLASKLGRKSRGSTNPGRRKGPALQVGTAPDPFGYVHVDVVRARNLMPMDRTIGKDASTWTSDPYVTATLLPSGPGAETVQTAVVPTTLFPTWNEELLLQAVPHVQSVKLCIFDKDKVGGDDMLGELVLPLPPRPDEAGFEPQPLLQGWYPLHAPSAERESLVSALRAIGREDDADALAGERHGHGSAPPGILGEVYVRLSWGHGGRGDDVNQRPAMRPRLATLRVRVHEARGLPAKYADRPVVTVKCESAMGVTPAVNGTRDPVFPADLSDFSFAVTELTTDVVLSVLDRDPFMGDQIAGEVCLPLHLLLAESMSSVPTALAGPRLAHLLPAALRGKEQPLPRTSRPSPHEIIEAPSDDEGTPGPGVKEDDWTRGKQVKWAELMPPRLPGEGMLRIQPRPVESLGALSFTVQLTMETTGFMAYMGPDVMPLDAPPGKDLSQAYSMGAMSVSLGRFIDGILLPMFAPLRTLLYIQSWQAPNMNFALIGALVFFTLFAWNLFRLLTPLWMMLWPVFNGYVSYLIHKDDFQPLFADEEADELKARNADRELQNHRNNMFWAAKTKALKAIREANDPAWVAAHAASGVGLGITETAWSFTSMIGLTHNSENETAAALSTYRKIVSKLEMAHMYGIYYGEILERWANMFTWRDKTLSANVAVGFGAIGLFLSAILSVVCIIGCKLGLGSNHVFLAFGLYCFRPSAMATTRANMDMLDYYLAYIPLPHASQVAGSALACTAPADRRQPMSESALKEKVEAEAKVAAQKVFEWEEQVKLAQGTVRKVSLSTSELLTFGWLYRLAWRSPNLPRDTHVQMCARIASATRPSRNWGDSTANSGPVVELPVPRTKSAPIAAVEVTPRNSLEETNGEAEEGEERMGTPTGEHTGPECNGDPDGENVDAEEDATEGRAQ
jgi:hypothetical protein